MPLVEDIPLHETTRERYLNYALSVITSRALPDVRDGLKPVQRRILYAMLNNLRLTPEGRYRKSATVVGEVMGKYHPHGDSAIYDAMVRMAQWFSLRYPLVDGQGNFGSLDGDRAAAMRYTEVKLRPIAISFLEEIKKQTVAFRPNYDGTLSEPVVLPARIPNLLINGAQGIAVGMATNIPPHNLAEVIDACILLSKKSSASIEDLLEHVKGPDFPTGGRILNTQEEIAEIYRTGSGAIDVRGEYAIERMDNGKKGIIINSIPYGLSKAELIEKIADLIRNERVPQLVDIRDESTDDIRIALELKRGADPEAAMAYVFKHTPLQNRFHVNLTCLVPTENPQIAVPRKLDLKKTLKYFLDFRLEVLTRRLEFELEQIEKRIHILKGFAIIFNALDEAIKIIRASNDKPDAAQRLIHRFQLSEIQADAILETKLYRLSKLEINDVLAELEEKEKAAAALRKTLGSPRAMKSLLRKELEAEKASYEDPRRTTIAGPDEETTFTDEDYIVKEDHYVIVTRDGWIKRQRSYSDLSAIRVREGDSIGWVLGGSTLTTVGVFSNFGRVFTTRCDQLPSTTGYGDPVQKLFGFKDGEQVVGVISFDPRVLPESVQDPEEDPDPNLFGDEQPDEPAKGPFGLAITAKGLASRFAIEAFSEASKKSGRAYMRPRKGDEVIRVVLLKGDENVCLASRNGRVLIFPAVQVPVFKSAGKGVIGMRLDVKDRLVGFSVANAAREGLEVETSRGRKEIIRTTKFEVSNRGNKGKQIIKRGSLERANYDIEESRLDQKGGSSAQKNLLDIEEEGDQ